MSHWNPSLRQIAYHNSTTLHSANHHVWRHRHTRCLSLADMYVNMPTSTSTWWRCCAFLTDPCKVSHQKPTGFSNYLDWVFIGLSEQLHRLAINTHNCTSSVIACLWVCCPARSWYQMRPNYVHVIIVVTILSCVFLNCHISVYTHMSVYTLLCLLILSYACLYCPMSIYTVPCLFILSYVCLYCHISVYSVTCLRNPESGILSICC